MKIFFIILGFLFFLISVIGIFVPLLPTTPFLLLSAGCFLRSSSRLYYWITHHKYFGQYISCYLKYKAVSIKTKICSLILLWLFIGFSIVFIVKVIWIQLLLFLTAIGVTIHILLLRTLTKKMVEEYKNKKDNCQTSKCLTIV